MRLVWNSFLSPPSSDRVKEPFQPLFFLLYPKSLWDGCVENLLTYFTYAISNAMTEGFNSKIQSLKQAARGFRTFANFRIRILFFCGKLNLYPSIP